MKKTILLLMAYYLIQGTVHNLGHPITPTYVNDLMLNPRMFGFFFSFMSLGIVAGSLIWGILGDRYHKKPLIIFGLLGYSLSQIGFVSSNNPFIMTFFRFTAGVSVSSSITLFLAYIFEVVEVKDRLKVLSITAALMALGTTFGYQIGGILGETYIKEVFYIQAIANAVYALFILLTMPKSSVIGTSILTIQDQMKEALKLKPSLLIFLFGLALATIAATNLSKYLDVYIIDSGYSTRELGTFVLVTGIVGIFTNFVIVPLVSKLNINFFLMRMIQVVSAIIIVLTFQITPLMLGLYTVFIMYVVLKAMFEPLEKDYISLHVKNDTFGSLMGVRQMFFSIGMVLGPLLSGFIYEFNPLFVFYFSALMFVIAFILISFSQRLSLKAEPFKSPNH